MNFGAGVNNMAIFTIRQKIEPSTLKVTVDINNRAKKHKKWLRLSIIFNIIFALYFLYLKIHLKQL